MPRPSTSANEKTDLTNGLSGSPLDSNLPTAPQIYEQIRLAIILSRLPSGTRVNENDVATHYGVSRTPVREAYVQLAADGLIETRRQVGSVVSPRDERRVLEGAIIRRALEGEVVAALASSPVSLRSLKPILLAQKLALEEQDVPAFFVADEEFHADLANLADIPNAWRLAHSVKSHTDRARFELMSGVENRTQLAYEEHELLCELISSGNVAGSRKLIEDHINSVFDTTGTPIGVLQQKSA
jgi:DNA-binding GntR family transcriptional regulator